MSWWLSWSHRWLASCWPKNNWLQWTRDTGISKKFFYALGGKKLIFVLFFDILFINIIFVLEGLFVYEPVQLGSIVPETIVDLWNVWGLEDINVCSKTFLVLRNKLFSLSIQKNFSIENNYLKIKKLYFWEKIMIHNFSIYKLRHTVHKTTSVIRR